MSKNRSRPCVVDELELTPTFDKEPIFMLKSAYWEGAGVGQRKTPLARGFYVPLKVVPAEVPFIPRPDRGDVSGTVPQCGRCSRP